MNAFARVDKETFLRFASEHAEERYEYVRGRIVQQMTGGTRNHSLIVRRLAAAIERQIDSEGLLLLTDRGVDIESIIRYPDIVVEPSDEPGNSLMTGRPAIIVEVLSPSTSSNDLDVKPAEYLSIASLDVYLIASQSEPALLLFERRPDGTFPQVPREIEGRASRATFSGRGFRVTLDLKSIYEGVS
jgi:Uma2 family endonuclease